MRLRDFFLRLTQVLALLALVPLWAQTAARPKVEIRAVRFNLVAVPGTTVRWLEADLELDTRVLGGPGPFVDRVRVKLGLGARATGGTYRFYRAEMEAVALEAGPAHFRFYLPAEVVKRDGLGGEPEFWSVKITAGGEAQPDTARSVSVALREPERLRSFEARLAAEAPANDGVLVPQHLSPFVAQYPAATPSAVRRAQ